MTRTAADITRAVQAAGVVGAGGGGFPTHIKLESRVDTVIANGSECEPLLASDKILLKEKPHLVVEGLKHAMKATGAGTGYIAVKAHYREAIAALERELPGDGSVLLHLLDNYYPAGDEFLTVYDVVSRVIPEGGLPLHVGVLVNNVLSLAQVAQAVDGKPVTERPVTIAGSVNRPQVITVPVGTTYRDLLELAGGTVLATDVLLDGGPVMGRVVEDLDRGIAKTCGGVVALPEDHFIMRIKNTTVSQMVKKSRAACCQCIRCTDLCPRNLVGHAIYPHMTMRTIDYNMSEPTDHITSAFLCSQCGVCELVACDFMQLSPRKIYAEYQKLLKSRGIKNPHRNRDVSVLPELEYRKVPMPTVIKKLDLTDYEQAVPFTGYKEVERVRIPLNGHAGSPARPTVSPGNKVKRGDIVGEPPPDQAGAVCHASIEGRVTDIAPEWIEIQR